MTIAEVQADHYRIPLPVTLSDSTHGEISHFELITLRLRDTEGAEGLGYTYTVGAGGAAIHSVLARDLAPLLEGQE
ncbi:MAG: uroporphyrinogen decarboxylase, partial [Alphaproteobacteria bacterium]